MEYKFKLYVISDKSVAQDITRISYLSDISLFNSNKPPIKGTKKGLNPEGSTLTKMNPKSRTRRLHHFVFSLFSSAGAGFCEALVAVCKNLSRIWGTHVGLMDRYLS